MPFVYKATCHEPKTVSVTWSPCSLGQSFHEIRRVHRRENLQQSLIFPIKIWRLPARLQALQGPPFLSDEALPNGFNAWKLIIWFSTRIVQNHEIWIKNDLNMVFKKITFKTVRGIWFDSWKRLRLGFILDFRRLNPWGLGVNHLFGDKQILKCVYMYTYVYIYMYI